MPASATISRYLIRRVILPVTEVRPKDHPAEAAGAAADSPVADTPAEAAEAAEAAPGKCRVITQTRSMYKTDTARVSVLLWCARLNPEITGMQ